MIGVTIKVIGEGTVVVKIGDSLYTYPLAYLLLCRGKDFKMEQQR